MIRLATKQELEHIEKDPVRPHISKEWRTRSGREVYVLERDGEVAACICVAYMDEVPTSEKDMKWVGMKCAVFYTVWSYKRGYGRTIINSALEELKDGKIKKAVTLSPLTTMAERFHIRNGAKLIGKYEHCQNFEYKIPESKYPVDNEDTKGTRMDDNWYYFKKEE